MNKDKLLIVIYFLLISYACVSQSKKINGISFVASPQKITQKHIYPLKKVSANYVALMPFGFIKDLATPKIVSNSKRQWFGETTEGIKQYANQFKKEGIQLMIKPQIWVWGGKYTGYISMTSEENWKQLETSYTEFILMYARLAQEINAEIFSIGTELEKFVQQRPYFWKSLITKIRKVYKGKVTYAANWDEYKRVTFWNQLDYIGVDAYFPLSEKKSPTVEQLEIGWGTHKSELKRVQKTYKKPILFTEYGYRSIDYATKEPWDSKHVKGSVNLQAQANGLQAIYNQFWNEDWFAGGFLWKWFLKHEAAGGKENNRFTLQNKPAEALIKKLYAN